MDIISLNEAATANGRIEKVIAQPDSVSGLVTMPSVVATGEVISIPTGRTVVHPNLQVDGTLDVQGTLFIPSGGSVSTTEVDATVVKQNGNVVANDSAVVHKTGDETIAGVKTFSNNVGIGVAPSDWGSPEQALQIGGASLSTRGVCDTLIGANYYYNTVDKYKSDGYASKLNLYNGAYFWQTAPSGTAGNTITWTNTMTLGNNGNLLVGTTTDNGVDKLQVDGSINIGGMRIIGRDLTLSANGGSHTFTNLSMNSRGAQLTLVGLLQNIGSLNGMYLVGIYGNAVSSILPASGVSVTVDHVGGTITVTNNNTNILSCHIKILN